MATLIKNIPKPSFAIEGNKGINFPLKGYCLEFDPLDLKNCPLFVDPADDFINQTSLVLEEDPNVRVLLPCDLSFDIVEYVAQGNIEFDNLNSSIQITLWGSSSFYTCLYKEENFVMYSGSTVTKAITKNQITSLIITDETGPREFKIKMATDPKKNEVFLINTLTYIPMKTVLDPKIANQYNLVSIFKGGSSTVTFSF
jgi:hypothetical protein